MKTFKVCFDLEVDGTTDWGVESSDLGPAIEKADWTVLLDLGPNERVYNISVREMP